MRGHFIQKYQSVQQLSYMLKTKKNEITKKEKENLCGALT